MPNNPKILEKACISLVLTNLLLMYAVLCNEKWIKLLAIVWLGFQSLDHVRNTKQAIAEIEDKKR